MTQLVCSTSISNVGCTFLDWSIHYLTGQTDFWNQHQGLTQLVDNPCQGSNAHQHLKNHPAGLEQTQQCVEYLQSHSNFATLYPVAPHISRISQQQPGLDTWTYQHIASQEYNDTIKWLDQIGAKIIFVSLNKNLPLYAFAQPRFQSKNNWNNEKRLDSIQDVWNFFSDYFFQDSALIFQQQKLTEIWDTREFFALNLRPLAAPPLQLNLDFDHYWVDSQDLWFNGKQKLLDILAWLNLEPNAKRYQNWCEIFEQWQNLQIKALKFQWQYQHIVDSTVNNWSYPIDLTFEQEVVIQHCLIYQHNLNIKTWQLEKFPNNTQLLHQLLEPNCHTL